ncbi:MAG: D-alanyl-D-alanine carboxypeptidase family protein, partial [Spirochaetaceae bacterium]|nr:D-alanyl-D-alanine carboxypeptidase family protein [Spirochaetaceae bacterium]
EGKEDITGYSFEPWHYRFVGRYHASEMHRLDMCLED